MYSSISLCIDGHCGIPSYPLCFTTVDSAGNVAYRIQPHPSTRISAIHAPHLPTYTLSLSIMDLVQDFAREHVAQISATIALVTYAVSRNKLTPAGVLSGVVVAIIHMLHPWQAFFWLLMVFFLLGTLVTKVRT